MLLLSAFPNEYNLNIQKSIVERFTARAADMKHLQYCTVEETNQFQYISDKVGSLGAMGTWGDGAEISLDEPKSQGTYTLTQTGYGLGFAVGRHLVRYGMLGNVQRWAASLADSAIQTLRAKFASLLNNGFSTSYAYRESGVALISASHLTSGGTRSNILAAATALSFAAYDSLVQVAANNVDYRGKLNPINVDQLIVPIELAATAAKIKGSPLEPDTTDNNVNPFFNAAGGIVVEDHLTSSTAWFLRDSSSYNLIGKVGLPFRASSYLDQPTQSLVHFAEMDFAYGADDWEGLVGSAGA